ncbi:hypothetical protein NZD85_02415 [Empedobacter stercoris]|uniref:Uncharacterized protein n=1 Tax=Empedobacter stercoris TaxID=1628248 RepID=A0ABX1WJ91_9FLAO|nr:MULTISPECIES: hypothetical protein [Empedobacter]HJD87534.1 hypothetical protein [Empedobacter falsenii]MCA4782528.1 hypothetical protein [Empedobacter stercoris]MCA4808935.1 hypothetical protein [Empedobacter stercoris]MDM1523261.1 hypothetical protein [Empedobacter sp. 225-1]MDM1542508.1 hypothetical protein [Empedobacter sp. 189-2]
MENKELTIREVIYRDMDTMIMAKLRNGSNISIDDLIDISSYLAASLFRERWKQKGELSEGEVNVVLGNIGDFCNEHFGEYFTQQDFDKIVKISQLLLQKPTFDNDSQEFFDSILKTE